VTTRSHKPAKGGSFQTSYVQGSKNPIWLSFPKRKGSATSLFFLAF